MGKLRIAENGKTLSLYQELHSERYVASGEDFKYIKKEEYPILWGAPNTIIYWCGVERDNGNWDYYHANGTDLLDIDYVIDLAKSEDSSVAIFAKNGTYYYCSENGEKTHLGTTLSWLNNIFCKEQEDSKLQISYINLNKELVVIKDCENLLNRNLFCKSFEGSDCIYEIRSIENPDKCLTDEYQVLATKDLIKIFYFNKKIKYYELLFCYNYDFRDFFEDYLKKNLLNNDFFKTIVEKHKEPAEKQRKEKTEKLLFELAYKSSDIFSKFLIKNGSLEKATTKDGKKTFKLYKFKKREKVLLAEGCFTFNIDDKNEIFYINTENEKWMVQNNELKYENDGFWSFLNFWK